MWFVSGQQMKLMWGLGGNVSSCSESIHVKTTRRRLLSVKLNYLFHHNNCKTKAQLLQGCRSHPAKSPRRVWICQKNVSCSRISPPLCMGLIASSAGRKAHDSLILVTGKSRKSTNAQSNNFRTEGRTCDCAFALALIFTKVAPERSGRSHLTLLII